MLDVARCRSGTRALRGALSKQSGHSARIALRTGFAGVNVNATLAEIMPATNVPWPSLAALVHPEPIEHEVLAADDRAVQGDVRKVRANAGVDHRYRHTKSCETRGVLPGDVGDRIVDLVGLGACTGDLGQCRVIQNVGRVGRHIESAIDRDGSAFARGDVERTRSRDVEVLGDGRFPDDRPQGRKGTSRISTAKVRRRT